MNEHLDLPLGVLVAAYGMALLAFALPLAAIGSTFAGVVLLRRGAPTHGWAVIVLGVALAVSGALMLG